MELIALLVGIVSVIAALVGTVLTVLVSLIPFVIMAFVLWQVVNGKRAIVVSGPLVDALAVSSAAAALPKLDLVKVGTCKACAAPRTTPSRSAYVHCDQCGQLTDWDFKAAMADKRSKAPGPAY